LLVVIAIIALLVSILLPSLTRARELAKQAVCRTRLKGLGTSLGIYQNENDDKFPVLAEVDEDTQEVTYSSSVASDPSMQDGSTKQDALDSFWDSESDCNIQPMYLLIAHGHCGADQFQCPSDTDYIEPKNNATEIGFSDWKNVSYAFQPFTHHEDNKAYPGLTGMDGAVVIAGDKPTEEGTWTKNHNEYGGSFLSYNQSVAFHDDEFNMVGWNRNYVYGKDVSSDGELDTDADDVDSKDDISKNNSLPDYVNDTVLIWKSD
jgi:competence protein ComGC